ncbi:hypothetical protein J8273_6393 [Carpediemonas membranifera]|uniref:Uncharacterized protein n=1 Tax=Carpediemonas membranifera TaxID=201153 RepID=A0A8J6E041_9EUKA|nr:hypothetical protein J8273_6393 [Carpediemonas membranifera]|eukprot:KAG9391628.1 hypothetical protein J8273_6393 [Carpediemonas membranifera]
MQYGPALGDIEDLIFQLCRISASAVDISLAKREFIPSFRCTAVVIPNNSANANLITTFRRTAMQFIHLLSVSPTSTFSIHFLSKPGVVSYSLCVRVSTRPFIDPLGRDSFISFAQTLSRRLAQRIQASPAPRDISVAVAAARQPTTKAFDSTWVEPGSAGVGYYHTAVPAAIDEDEDVACFDLTGVSSLNEPGATLSAWFERESDDV